jgi:hypothetical protein
MTVGGLAPCLVLVITFTIQLRFLEIRHIVQKFGELSAGTAIGAMVEQNY